MAKLQTRPVFIHFFLNYSGLWTRVEPPTAVPQMVKREWTQPVFYHMQWTEALGLENWLKLAKILKGQQKDGMVLLLINRNVDTAHTK